MNKIYCFSLFDTGYISVHSLIRELFDSPKKVCPSLCQGDLLYVLSKSPPAKSLNHSCQNMATVNEKTKKIELESHVAFCNRHRRNVDTNKYSSSKKIDPQEALDKFCSLSGLKKERDKIDSQGQARGTLPVGHVECNFLGPHKENKFNIHNAFHIQGSFNISDHKKFNQALINGVGSRKSYGYGLILIKQGGKYESGN